MKNKYLEIQFICYSINYNNVKYIKKQANIFNDLKKIKGILLYKEFFKDYGNISIILSVIILDIDKEKQLKKQIIELAKKNNIDINIITKTNDKKVNMLLNKTYLGDIEY